MKIDLSDINLTAIQDAYNNGRFAGKIAAIKVIRQQTKLPLTTAKAFIELLEVAVVDKCPHCKTLITKDEIVDSRSFRLIKAGPIADQLNSVDNGEFRPIQY